MAYGQKVFGKIDAHTLLDEYGSPLYVYDESILRQRCREMKNLISYQDFKVSYSAKANTNVELLRIIRDEGLDVDAMSPGEMYLEMKAGFTPDRIMFVGNNVPAEEMQYAIDRGIYISVDSLSQLETLGRIHPGSNVCLRINPGIGAGHHEKVITAGKKTKFGIAIDDLKEARNIARHYNMTITGLNHHIGSLFLEGDEYLAAAEELLGIAATFPTVEMVDFGGGFGIPYRHQVEKRLDLIRLGQQLEALIKEWVAVHRPVQIRIEPGRYIVAESGVLLGRITAIKENYGNHFIGCDIGFNTLIRPVMYDSYHEITVIPAEPRTYKEYQQPAFLAGPICESGDILAHGRPLPVCQEGDAIMIHDTGAYGYAMASNYNSRLLPAEVLISQDRNIRLIRPAQTLEDLWP